MKKIIIFALALIMTGSIQAQDVITLPQPEISKLSMSLGDALQQRRSARSYSNQEISLQTLSTILWAACGVSDPKTGKITAPYLAKTYAKLLLARCSHLQRKLLYHSYW